jgi:hypothetical protein
MTYAENINQNKESYPFENWRENGIEYEMEQYTPENCGAAKQIMDDLIEGLVRLGESSSTDNKIELIKNAVIAYNNLNDEVEGLIETGEREDLCDVFENIAQSAGINTEQYDDDITFQWRTW